MVMEMNFLDSVMLVATCFIPCIRADGAVAACSCIQSTVEMRAVCKVMVSSDVLFLF